MKLGMYQMYRWHRILWNWLAKTGVRDKREWPGWELEKCPKLKGLCFPCEYARDRASPMEDIPCGHCPIRWPHGLICMDDGSLWNEWECMYNPKLVRNHYANEIANVKLKPYKVRSLAWCNRR